MNIVRFSASHISEAAEIEKLCFSEPWSEGGLLLLTEDNAISFAAVEENGTLASYAGMVTVLDEGEIVNVATHPDFRRRGYAREVLRRLIEEGEARGIKFMVLEVRESNLAAQALYASFGFAAVSIRKDFYRLPRENAIVMARGEAIQFMN